MFNFYNEIKQNFKGVDAFDQFNIINLSGKILYVEGHKGLVTLSRDVISFRVRGGVVMVEGSDMILSELSENTIKICGKICKVEQI